MSRTENLDGLAITFPRCGQITQNDSDRYAMNPHADIAERTDLVRLDAVRQLDKTRQTKLGQFMTPAPVGRLIASMLDASGDDVSVLEPAAGIGSLVAALVEELCQRDNKPARLTLTTYEIDPALADYLNDTLELCKIACTRAGIELETHIRRADFLKFAAESSGSDLFSAGGPSRFDCVIMNPPYGKIRSDSEPRRQLRALGIETSNLYTGFLAAASVFLKDGGEIAAITPRSFCNGPYFRAFRRFFLESMAFRHIHLFKSRSAAFSDDDVLQENIIFRAVRSSERNGVAISTSVGPSLEDAETRLIDHGRVVWPQDPQAFIHIVPNFIDQRIADAMAGLKGSLAELELDVSTGPVVDFRAREFLRKDPGPGTAPLIYATHLSGGSITWPRSGRKPNAIAITDLTTELLLPNQCYVLVKRFTAKEERRRIVAVVHDSTQMQSDLVGFENHLNYFHKNGAGFNQKIAVGLAAFLNSTLVDTFFRQFSGHTQVNATDLRTFRYPTQRQLESLAGAIGDEVPNQRELDRLIDHCILDSHTGETSPVQAKRRIDHALEILRDLEMPREQQNERSALTLLSLLELSPDTPWEEASNPLLGIHDMLVFFDEKYGIKYAENTRETVRRQTIHQFIHAGIAHKIPVEPNRPVNSPHTVYQIEPELLALVRTFGTKAWAKNLARYLEEVQTLRDTYSGGRNLEIVPLEIAPGELIELTPGAHSELISQIVSAFGPRFTPGGRPLYVGDTGNKFAYFDESRLEALGVEIDPHGKIPDVVIHYTDKNWLVLAEAVTSHGPMNPKRHIELARIFANAQAGLVYVTAFPDRSTMAKYLPEISWETEVWVADTPDHLIHFNGERFLGPYPART